MAEEIGQISFYLAKKENTFDTILQDEKIQADGEDFKIRNFTFKEAEIRFYCVHTKTIKTANPPWLDFVNEQIVDTKDKLSFATASMRPSGLLLVKLQDRIFAATFGVSGRSLLDKQKLLSDFGIKTAMNMCGNKELRQTKSRTHSITTQQIDRQLSRPSDAFDFGLGETELLKYISAQLESDKKVTLQGKENLTIKVIGDDKLTWDRLFDYCETFLAEYQKDNYKTLFPNYPNFQEVGGEKAAELDARIVERIKDSNFVGMHLAIPEFIPDDEFSFSYTNSPKRENIIVSHLDTAHFQKFGIFKADELDAEKLKSKSVFAYSHAEDKILAYRKWSLYRCIVAEIEDNDGYFVLSEGEWRKVDDDFFKSINDFIDNILEEEEISKDFYDIDISDVDKKQNREEVFNNTYVSKNGNALLFDKAKLRIGQSRKDKEFCDILEISPDEPMKIIHVKRHGGSSSVNHLFSQARFYCEFFLSDEVFLSEIRGHIEASDHQKKDDFLSHIKRDLADVSGKDYQIKLWVLYDNSKSNAPSKSDLPLMAKYEIKLAYDRLRNVNKYSSVNISMIPVEQVNFETAKKSK